MRITLCHVHNTYNFTAEDYLFVEWEEKTHDYKEHLIIVGKFAQPGDGGSCAPGARVKCKLKEGTYYAIVIAAGLCSMCLVCVILVNIYR